MIFQPDGQADRARSDAGAGQRLVVMRKWVVLAGWINRLRLSPTLAGWLKSFQRFDELLTLFGACPLRSKLNTRPAPARLEQRPPAGGWGLAEQGWPTRSTKGGSGQEARPFRC